MLSRLLITICLLSVILSCKKDSTNTVINPHADLARRIAGNYTMMMICDSDRNYHWDDTTLNVAFTVTVVNDTMLSTSGGGGAMAFYEDRNGYYIYGGLAGGPGLSIDHNFQNLSFGQGAYSGTCNFRQQ